MKRNKVIKLLTGRAELREQLIFKNRVCVVLIVMGIFFYMLKFFDAAEFNGLIGKGEYIYNGAASCFIIIGIVRILRNFRLLKNEDLLKRYEIAINDERNINIQKCALSNAVIAYTWLGFLAGLAAAPFNEAVACTILYSICSLLIIYMMFSFIFNKTM
ncbi:MAG: hypothetical protein Q4D26_01795 [Clostridia bacterium]|nr:hypothetical protein [Clostridia bacterium]